MQQDFFYDLDHPDFRAYMEEVHADDDTAHAGLIALYYKIRDGIRYNPYRVSLEKEDYKVSNIIKKKANYCIPKAILFTAGAKFLGYEANLGLADVKNHLSSGRFIELLGSDIFAFHGYSEVVVDGRRMKVTPVFDKALCAKFGVAPLEFDARSDALFQQFDLNGQRFMEYIQDRGTFNSVPFDYIMDGFQEWYPDFSQRMKKEKISGDLMTEE